MAIYEEEDFKKIWDPKWMRFNRARDKLKQMRLKRVTEEKQKEKDGTPTTDELNEAFGLDG